MNNTAELAGLLGEKDDFETWLGMRPKWLQTAAQQMVERKRYPTPDEIATLAKLCESEVLGEEGVIYSSLEPGALAHAAERPTLRVESISNVQGFSALKNGAEIGFGSANLTVIYGPNGSGKTAFSRLLKQACGSKAKDEIFPNIFEDVTPPSSACIRISLGGIADEIQWALETGPVGKLRNMHVFDSRTASMYINEKNEAAYEPSQMRFVSSLIRVCDSVSAHISARRAELPKKIPIFPADYAQTNQNKWINGLSAKVTEDAIEKACAYTGEQEAERVRIEMTLAQKDVAGRLVSIVQARTSLTQLNAYLATFKEKFSDAAVTQTLEARAVAIATRKAATEYAEKVFAEADLDGIGNQTWRLLWDQARKFSVEYAYPGIPFPNVAGDAKCVLCNQDLNEAAQERLKQFEAFVHGGLESAAKRTEAHLQVLMSRLPLIPSPNDWRVQLAVSKMPEDCCAKLHAALVARKDFAVTATSLENLIPLDWSDSDLAIAKLLDGLMVEEKSLLALKSDEKRAKMVAYLLELRAIAWMHENKSAIIEEVDRLKRVAALDKATSHASTVALTKKNNELAKSELSEGYQKRFATELKRLGGSRLKVIPESKQQGKGKTTFGITLTNTKKDAPAVHILSEGELRIVSLSAFLADITGATQISPFIFDDPISSLDQDFEERVVERLVSLAAERQVVVFTHRLSLLAQLEARIKAMKDTAELSKIEPAVKLHVETLRRMGNVTGIRVPFSARDSKPLKALNLLRHEYVPKLKNLLEQGDASYEHFAKGVCSDFRIVVEKCVESELLNDVITRFRRPINTAGKLVKLAKIKKEDCLLIDDLMSRYSVFEHSQSEELPAQVPDVTQIEADVNMLAEWVEEFSKRAVTA